MQLKLFIKAIVWLLLSSLFKANPIEEHITPKIIPSLDINLMLGNVSNKLIIAKEKIKPIAEKLAKFVWHES